MNTMRKHQFYRFTDPKDASFPKMIELFSKVPNGFDLSFDRGLTPIHLDDSIVSLSAILLNDDYYDLVVSNIRMVNDFSLVDLETIILLKIKAWLDMKKRKESGEEVDTKNIRKHKNDIFRLLSNVSPSNRLESSRHIQADVIQFVEQIKEDKPDLKNLGIRETRLDEMLEILEHIFLEKAEAISCINSDEYTVQ